MSGLSFKSQKYQFFTVPCSLGFLGCKEQKLHKRVYYKNKHESKGIQMDNMDKYWICFTTLAKAILLML